MGQVRIQLGFLRSKGPALVGHQPCGKSRKVGSALQQRPRCFTCKTVLDACGELGLLNESPCTADEAPPQLGVFRIEEQDRPNLLQCPQSHVIIGLGESSRQDPPSFIRTLLNPSPGLGGCSIGLAQTALSNLPNIGSANRDAMLGLARTCLSHGMLTRLFLANRRLASIACHSELPPCQAGNPFSTSDSGDSAAEGVDGFEAKSCLNSSSKSKPADPLSRLGSCTGDPGSHSDSQGSFNLQQCHPLGRSKKVEQTAQGVWFGWDGPAIVEGQGGGAGRRAGRSTDSLERRGCLTAGGHTRVITAGPRRLGLWRSEAHRWKPRGCRHSRR